MNSLKRRRTAVWPEPEKSIAGLVDTVTKRMGRDQAWFPQGPAWDIYNTKVRPELECLLEHSELPEGAPIFLRLYMIGRAADEARPMVMICCVSQERRRKGVSYVRDSGIIAKYPGFGLGSSLLFLEAPKPPKQCAGEMTEPAYQSEIVHLVSAKPWYDGKQLTIRHERPDLAQVATLGPIVAIGDERYHLTAWHPFIETDGREEPDFDQVEFEDIEYDGIHDTELDDESVRNATSRGSVSSVEFLSFSEGNSPVADDSASESITTSQAPIERPPSHSPPHITGKQRAEDYVGLLPMPIYDLSIWPKIYSAPLDYALSPANESPAIGKHNTILMPDEGVPNSLEGQGDSLLGPKVVDVISVADIPERETAVLVVTGSSGQMKGKIIPGAISSLRSRASSFQRLFLVQLEGLAWQGDSGSPVIDPNVGALYGHIVMVCTGTSLAYIVPASEVFCDIRKRFGLAATLDLAQQSTSTTYDGPSSGLRATTSVPDSTLLSGGPPSAHYQSIPSPVAYLKSYEQDFANLGKALMSHNIVEDNGTHELPNDIEGASTVAGPPQHRRVTSTQLPISRLASLSSNTTSSGSASGSLGNIMPPTPNSGPFRWDYQMNSQPFQRRHFPPVNPADQYPPCNTLYVGNLPMDASEEELKSIFCKQPGYKRLCFRTKQNGPMCFVEFKDISFATQALHELYGVPLQNSVKSGIRLSFSKNPLGVRSGQAPMSGSATTVANSANAFTIANGPPPGLSEPPGLNRMAYNQGSAMSAGINTPLSPAGSWSDSKRRGTTHNEPISAIGMLGSSPRVTIDEGAPQ